MGQCADHTALAGNEAAFSVEMSDHSVASRLSLGGTPTLSEHHSPGACEGVWVRRTPGCHSRGLVGVG